MKFKINIFNKLKEGEKMKHLYLIIFVTALMYVSGCSSDSGTGNGGIGGGGTGGGTVTFTMQGQANGGNFDFYFQPSVDVKVSKIIANLPAQNYFDTVINNNANYVFSKDSAYTWYSYTGVASGQAWKFTFSGNIVSNSSAYTSTANYTVP